MLLGVLVIAFPVSVFSDLWSNELHKTAWHSLNVIDEEDEGEETITRKEEVPINANIYSPDSVRSENDITDTRRSDITLSEGPGVFTPHSSSSVDEDHVVMRKDDLAELVRQMRTINDSQKKIRGILQKYRLPEATHSA